MFTRRLGLTTADVPLLAGGFVLLLGAAYLSTVVGAGLSLGALAVLAVLLLVVTSFLAVPHWAVAVTIPLFALIPVIKVLALPWLGPLKDLVTIGAILASLLLVIQRSATGERIRADTWACGLALLLIGLYVVNLGGRLERDAAWLHGMRLNALPLMLLVAGMTLPNPRRTLRWATGVADRDRDVRRARRRSRSSDSASTGSISSATSTTCSSGRSRAGCAASAPWTIRSPTRPC